MTPESREVLGRFLSAWLKPERSDLHLSGRWKDLFVSHSWCADAVGFRELLLQLSVTNGALT